MPGATYEVPALAIALLPASQRAQSKDYQAYSVEWLTLLASASKQKATVTVDSSSDFVALFVSGVVTDTATPPVLVANPMATLNISVGERNVFDKDVHWMNFVGTAGAAQGMFPLPFPLYMPRATTLQAFLTNLTATAFNYRLTFHGIVIHDYSRTTSRGY